MYLPHEWDSGQGMQKADNALESPKITNDRQNGVLESIALVLVVFILLGHLARNPPLNQLIGYVQSVLRIVCKKVRKLKKVHFFI